MGPKRERNKEKLREMRRQGEPSFPGLSGPSTATAQQASRIPRPSILLSSRQNNTRRETPALPSAVSKEPQAAASVPSAKSSVSKGLRVTFDLSKNGKDEGPETMLEEVIDCWEDLSDEGGSKGDDREYQINDEDIIDCEREFGDLGDEFMDFGHGGTTFGSGVAHKSRGRGTEDFFIGPRHVPGLNDIEDFNAIDDDEDGDLSDYDNVEPIRNSFNNSEPNVRYFSDDNSDDKLLQQEAVPDVVSVPTDGGEVQVAGLSNMAENFGPVSDNKLTMDSKKEKDRINNAAKSSSDNTGFSNSDKIPFIDGMDEGNKVATAAHDDDDDDEWETEPSGGSDESGQIYKIDNSYATKAGLPTVHNIGGTQTVHFLNPVDFDDEATMADQPSICEDDSDIITNEDLNAAFHSVMKEVDELVLEDPDERPNITVAVENEHLAENVDSRSCSESSFPLSNEKPKAIQETLTGEVRELLQTGVSDDKTDLTQVAYIEELASKIDDRTELSQLAFSEKLADNTDDKAELPQVTCIEELTGKSIDKTEFSQVVSKEELTNKTDVKTDTSQVCGEQFTDKPDDKTDTSQVCKEELANKIGKTELTQVCGEELTNKADNKTEEIHGACIEEFADKTDDKTELIPDTCSEELVDKIDDKTKSSQVASTEELIDKADNKTEYSDDCIDEDGKPPLPVAIESAETPIDSDGVDEHLIGPNKNGSLDTCPSETNSHETRELSSDIQESADVSWSLKVSIGYECKETKKPFCASETESEGELVYGEDKCVGTADSQHSSEEEPLDLSTSDKTSSKGEDDKSEGRDSLSLRSEDESQSEQVNLALDADKHCVSANEETSRLDVPVVNRIDTSPSPEIPSDAPLGNSESGKEKEKINEKKTGKKKSKKNKKDSKSEQAPKTEYHPERPKLVRGKSWKEKREKYRSIHGDAIPLSFGKELCESELVEGTSNLLTETYTEASLVTASRCSTETTVVTETPCTACSSLTGEFSESETLCKGCSRNEKKRSADVMTQLSETKSCVEKSSSASSSVNDENESVKSSQEREAKENPTIQVTEEKDDFYIVKACEVAVPLEVLTEYVADSESSEDTNGLKNISETNKTELLEKKSKELAENNDIPDIIEGNVNKGSPETSMNLLCSKSIVNVSDERNPTYFDAKDSSCTDSVGVSYDYIESFPEIVGTQNLSYVYSYEDDAEYERQTDRPKLTVKPLKTSLGSSGVMVVNLGEDNTENSDTPPLSSGDIIYEGPCMCGPGNRSRNESKEFGSEADILCVPPLIFNSNCQNYLIDGKDMGVETHELEISENMGSTPEDSLGNCEGDSSDIKSRIKEIVGPRLHQKRGRHTVRRRGGGSAAGENQDQPQQLNPERGGGGRRDESPMPNSSPASSSGVQGSDEMSPSRSRSHSPFREESASPTPSTENALDPPYEAYRNDNSPIKGEPVKTEKSRVQKDEGGVDASPEEKSQADYGIKSFRDMYHINPVYTTDSDDHDELNELDTFVHGSAGLSYDPDRSITVSSFGSKEEESPILQDSGTSPPLPQGGRGTKKVPKVTKQLRETQGIVQRWEVLQAQAVERQRQSGHVRELQRQVKNLRLTLEKLAEEANETPQTDALDNHRQLELKLQEAKALLEDVRARKADVSSLNLAVHRFFTDSGYTLAQLKDEVNDLYILHDEAQRRATNEVSRLEALEATWKLWETEADELTRALGQDRDTLKVLDGAIQKGSVTDSMTASAHDVARLLNDRCRSQQPGKKLVLQHTRTQGVDIQGSTLSLGTSGDDCLSDSGTSGYESCSSEELSERERRLANLRRLARDLEASLSPDSQAWASITNTLSNAEKELQGLQKHCRELVVRSTETLDQTKTSPQLRKRSWAKDSKVGRLSRVDRRISSRDSGRGISRRGWMWRVVRAALPFQAALLLLFCVACLLEPNCCDTHNNLTNTLTPQLRYVHGPPPV